MKDKEFQEKRERWTEERFELCDRKAPEYSNDEDRVKNFKRGADRLPLKCPHCGEIFHPSPLYILMIYMMKHFDALCNYAGVGYLGDNPSESIEGRINDAGNYTDLFRAVLDDIRKSIYGPSPSVEALGGLSIVKKGESDET